MDKEIESFREEIVRWCDSQRRGERRYTVEMKAKALKFAARLRGQGLAMDAVVKRLGICAGTLYAWRAERRPAGMVPVMIAEAQAPAPASAMRLVSPRGYRLENLPATLALAMLRELG